MTITIFSRAVEQFRPPAAVRSLAWMTRHAATADGHPWDPLRYPLFGAPGGPNDALDDDQIRVVWLQLGIRMGKTTWGQAAILYRIATRGTPQLFASPTRTTSVNIASRLYQMVGHCPPLRPRLRPEWQRRQDQIDLAPARIFIGWAGSDASLADVDVDGGHAAEVDKWEHGGSATEGDPLARFLDRASNHPRHKYVAESTPAVRGHSRVEAGREGSTDCRPWVACPHCGRRQPLSWGHGDDRGGLEWDKLDGRHDPDHARLTGRYRCRDCAKKITDRHRARMIRSAVWIPAGCGCDDQAAAAAASRWAKGLDRDGPGPWAGWGQADWITGTPDRDGSQAGYQASRLHDLTLTWGELADRFVRAQQADRQARRQFRNEWEAETWLEARQVAHWETMGRQQMAGYQRGTVPPAAWFLTAGVDVQDDLCYWVLRAWGPGATSWLIDWGLARKPVDAAGRTGGTTSDLSQLDQVLVDRSWPVVGGESSAGFPELWAARIAVDTGYRIHDVHSWIRTWPGDRVCAVAGDQAVRSGFWRVAHLEKNTRTGKPYPGGLRQYQRNVDAFKEDIQDRWSVPPDQPGAWLLPQGILQEGRPYLQQVVNEAPTDHTTPRGRAVRSWQLVRPGVGNHYWDCEVYARAAADFITRGRWSDWAARPAPPPRQPDDRPSGRRQITNRRRIQR